MINMNYLLGVGAKSSQRVVSILQAFPSLGSMPNSVAEH
jgi:hypothetical protein